MTMWHLWHCGTGSPDMQTLYDIAQDYEAYLREHPESLLCKFLLCVKVQVGHTLCLKTSVQSMDVQWICTVACI